MADSPDKEQEKQKKEDQKRANKPIVTVCTLNLRQILVALHEKALKEVGEQKSGDLALTIQNSAIEGAGGKDAKFYGAGQHIIACIPKEAKGLDKNKVLQKDAIGPLKTYIQWFVGPDLKKGVEEKDLLPLEDGAEGKVDDNHEKKEDIEKSKKDSVAGEKYESTIFVPSFSQYLLTEEGEAEGSEDGGEDKDKSKDKDKGKEAAEEEKGTSEASAQGWYVQYKLTIPGQKEHALADAMKSLGKDIIKAVGVKFTSLFGGDSETHTIGGLMDDLDSVFGKLDAKEFESQFNQEMQKKMKQTSASAAVWDTATILKYLKKEVGSSKSKITPAKYALCVRVDKNDKSYKLFNEDAIANLVNAAITGAMRGVFKKAFYGVKSKDVILVNNYSDNKKAKDSDKFETRGKAAGAVADSMKTVQAKPLILESVQRKHDLLDCILEECFKHLDTQVMKMSCIKTGNALLESMFDDIGAELLLEGHSEEQLNVEKELDRIGVENLTKNVDELRKNYLEFLGKVKKDNPKNEYVQKILVNSKNWISKEFIGKLRDQEEADVSTIKKMLKDCVSRVGKTNDVKFELQALVDALKKLPDGPKKDDEQTDEDEKITITFKDIEDPSQLSDPEAPSDDDKKKYEQLGDPLKLVPGEDVKIPEVEDKGEKKEWKFIGFEPDPENMDETGDTYAIYSKEDAKTVKITFYDADPKTGKKLDKPLGDPIEIDAGTKPNASEEVSDAQAEYNKQLSDDKKEGYTFKGWSPETSEAADEDTDIVAKYIEDDKKDEKFTVMFQYAPDQEKPDDVQPIEVDGKEQQEVAAGEKAVVPEAPKIDGYEFKEWDADGADFDKVDKDIMAVAKYEKKEDEQSEESSDSKDSFTVKIVQPDAEDPENTKTQKDVATISVFIVDDKRLYKPDDLSELAKSTKSKDEADRYSKAAKDNEDAFKKVDNIQALTKDNAPYKFIGWAGPDGEVESGEDALQKIIDKGPADGEEELVVKAAFDNDMKAKHTDIDFYIVPMKGLADKASKSK